MYELSGDPPNLFSLETRFKIAQYTELYASVPCSYGATVEISQEIADM